MKKVRFKYERGITLIALVITIIILLILAGVSINLVVGENGVLKKATESVEVNNKSTAIEQVSMAWSSCQTDYLTSGAKSSKNTFFTKEKLNENLSQGEVTEVNFESDEEGTSDIIYKVNNTSYKIQISANGVVSLFAEKLLDKVKSNPAEYYGKKVSGYIVNGISDWRILYADDENVFLITADYLPSTLAVECNDTMTANENYSVLWSSAPTVSSTTNVVKFSPVTTETMAWTGNYGTNDNGRCVSTLLDISKWANFVDSNYATMAIGSPTLNMWVASWNTKYPMDKIYCNQSDALGYKVGLVESPEASFITDTVMQEKTGYEVEDNMYYPYKTSIDNDNCKGYWISSPMAAHRWAVGYINCNGGIGFSTHSGDFTSLRPVVCLNSNVKTTSNDTDSVIVLAN